MTNKRLLILGGQQKLCDIVIRAKEMGVYTVVTDWYEDSPAKKLADKAYMVSTSDVEGVLQLIREERIDGVITGYIDSYLPYYYEICQRAQLPCYLNQKTLDCCTNKRKFKELCSRIGIETIPDVDLADRENLEYPILIKPVDNSGSKGITVCYEESMIDTAVERGLRFSKSKAIVAEKFMSSDYVAAYYTVCDGEAQLSLLMDKDMNRVVRGVVPYPTAMTSPSRYHDRFTKRMDQKMKALARKLEMVNGTFEIGFFVSGNHYYAVELTARLTATREYIFTRDMSGMDTLEMYIRYALTGQFRGEILQNKKYDDSAYCMLFCFVKEGQIGRISGLETVRNMPGVLDVLHTRDIGAKIREDGSYGQLFSKIYLKAENVSQLAEQIRQIQQTLQIYSVDHSPMIVTEFHAEAFLLK